MITVLVPGVLRADAGGAARLDVEAAGTLGGVLDEMGARWPRLARRLRDEQGELRRYVNIYVDGEDCRRLAGLATPVADGASCDPTNKCRATCSAGACVPTPPFTGVSLQLDAIVAAVATAPSEDVAPSLRKVISAKTGVIRAKLMAAQAVAGSSVKREGRMLKAATKTLNGLKAAIGKAKKGHKPKISASLADALLARLACAGAAVQGLQAELAR